MSEIITRVEEGWERDMAITWAAYFMAITQDKLTQEERAAFMQFVAFVSNPMWQVSPGREG